MSTISTLTYESPCGRWLLGSAHGRLCLCSRLPGRMSGRDLERVRKYISGEIREAPTEVLEATCTQLNGYFDGRRQEFSLPLLLCGTEFQKQVWQELLTIPYGTTVSYAELARRIGRPKSVRALANAVGANPIGIIVPCHRIIGSDGSLTGYAGGLDAKAYLLQSESAGLFSPDSFPIS